MKLKVIFEVENNEQDLQNYRDTYKNLVDKYRLTNKYGNSYFPKNEMFNDYKDVSSYARRTHSGKIKDGIDLTELELSMICDDGFSYFGGSSNIGKDGSFTVVIYTD